MTLFWSGLLATAEQDHCFDLVASLQEALSAFALRLVVVLVNLQAETNLFEDGVRLVAPGLFRLLRRFVLELAKVHDLRDGRLGVGSNLNQIQVGLAGQTKSVFDSDYSDLFAIGANKTDLRNADSVIGTRIADACLLLNLGGHTHETDASRQRKKEFPRISALLTSTSNRDALAIPLARNGALRPGNLIDAVNGWENLHFRTERMALGASTRIAE